MSWMPPYAHVNPYPSWGTYDTRENYPSYFRSSRQHYAAPKRSTFDEQSHVKDRFNRKEPVQSSRNKKEVVKQVYQVKKDGRKCATSDLFSNNKEPVKVLTLATKGNEVSQSSAKSEGKKLRVHKAKKELALVETESQPRCPLGLAHWQEKELQRLSAHELRKKNMAWVPKRSNQNRTDVRPSIATSVKKVKKEKDGRKSAISDPTPNDKKPAEPMLAAKDKKVKQVKFKDPIVKFGQAKPEMPKVRKNLPVHKPKSQPGRPLGLPYSQQKKLKRLRAKELEKRNMPGFLREILESRAASHLLLRSQQK